MVFGVPRANYSAGFVDAEFGLYASLCRAFEETEDMLAVFVFLLFFVMLGILFGGFLVGIFVYCLVDFFVRCVEG